MKELIVNIIDYQWQFPEQEAKGKCMGEGTPVSALISLIKYRMGIKKENFKLKITEVE